MSKLQILLTLAQVFGPAVFKEGWPLIQQLLQLLKNTPKTQVVMGRAMAIGRADRVNEAQKAELFRLVEEAGVSRDEVEIAIGEKSPPKVKAPIEEEPDLQTGPQRVKKNRNA